MNGYSFKEKLIIILSSMKGFIPGKLVQLKDLYLVSRTARPFLVGAKQAVQAFHLSIYAAVMHYITCQRTILFILNTQTLRLPFINSFHLCAESAAHYDVML